MRALCTLNWGDGSEGKDAATLLGETSSPAHLSRALSLTGTLDSREHVTGTQAFFLSQLKGAMTSSLTSSLVPTVWFSQNLTQGHDPSC